jgi:SOS response regulatory protein OraA/RecX
MGMNLYGQAMKLLAGRDYTVSGLRQTLEARHGAVPAEIIDRLIQQNFLNDRRFAENYVSRLKARGRPRLRNELVERGVPPEIADEVLSKAAWPSLRQSLKYRMDVWKIRQPLQRRDAARLFRVLSRLGYDEDEIREELEQLHEQQ